MADIGVPAMATKPMPCRPDICFFANEANSTMIDQFNSAYGQGFGS